MSLSNPSVSIDLSAARKGQSCITVRVGVWAMDLAEAGQLVKDLSHAIEYAYAEAKEDESS